MSSGRRSWRGASYAAVLALACSGMVVAFPGEPASATTADLTTWSLSSGLPAGASPITLDLTKVSLRGADFKVLLQADDGTYADVTASLPVEQDYLGTVEGHPDAAVAATVMSDGTVRGEVVFDRGFTWWFSGNAVTGTRGSTNVTYKWPIRHAMGTDLIGSTVDAYEFGDDIDSSMYAALGGSVTKAVDLAELSMNNMRLPYMQSLGLMPQLGTVILRGSATKDPYAGLAASAGAYLGAVKTEWNTNHSPHPEAQVQVVSNRFGGGVAWISSIFGSNGYGAIGASPTAQDGWAVVARHEASHNWGPYDENGGDPEGPTIQSGNGFARYDSTEVYSVAQNRTSAIKSNHLVAGTYTATHLPPYAGTDYLPAVAHSAGATFDPLANDHSPNGSPLHLVSVSPTSALGAAVTTANGFVTYHPLSAATTDIDTFTYVLGDANGLTATGVVMVKNLAPYRSYPMERSTATGADIYNKDVESGAQTDWLYPGSGKNITWTLNQPVERDVTLTFQTRAWTGDQASVSVDGGTPVTFTVPKAVEDLESEGQVDTPATVTVHLTAGLHTLVYSALNTGHFVDGLQTSWADSAPTVPSTTPSVNAEAGQAFTFDAASGVTDPDLPTDSLTYALQSGPAWLRISATGSLTGTAPTAGSYGATVAVTDASGLVTTEPVTILVVAGLGTVGGSTPTAYVGSAYAATPATGTGGAAPYVYSATGLPAGLSIEAATGAVSGTPSTAGTSTVTVTVTDAYGVSATRTVGMKVVAALVVSGSTPPPATVGATYSATPVTASGGQSPYAYTATGMPAGLSINAATGAVTGRPSAAGISSATITATDANGHTASSTVTFTVKKGKVATRVVISGGNPYSMRSRQYYPVRVYVKTACLPTGYVYLTVSGTPAIARTYRVPANSTTGVVARIALSRRTGILRIVTSYAGSSTCAAAPAYSFSPRIIR